MKVFEVNVSDKNKNGGISLNNKQRHKFLLDHSYTHLVRKCDGSGVIYPRNIIELAIRHRSKQNLLNVATHEEFIVIHPEVVLRELADQEIEKLLEDKEVEDKEVEQVPTKVKESKSFATNRDKLNHVRNVNDFGYAKANQYIKQKYKNINAATLSATYQEIWYQQAKIIEKHAAKLSPTEKQKFLNAKKIDGAIYSQYPQETAEIAKIDPSYKKYLVQSSKEAGITAFKRKYIVSKTKIAFCAALLFFMIATCS